MLIPTLSDTPLGLAREYTFAPPYEKADWILMGVILKDATMMGFTPMRFIHDESVRVVITQTGE